MFLCLICYVICGHEGDDQATEDLEKEDIDEELVQVTVQVRSLNFSSLRVENNPCLNSSVHGKSQYPVSVLQNRSVEQELLLAQEKALFSHVQVSIERL